MQFHHHRGIAEQLSMSAYPIFVAKVEVIQRR